ncbi:hypothetical protein SERLA73DRAFT_81607 [Serpula lacrymans var. lacrymans S7.3]|uniref:Uncharacterized protein n=1 Tax=Serpula lacrymans var. lacrymans (strain S7.3) TaxID=936435 RepID=F8QL39_SERL3|nr:hypothetical protein SERLA73DRAFT_81607 [Serpula lacrymans var. lacrymans S7.3]
MKLDTSSLSGAQSGIMCPFLGLKTFQKSWYSGGTSLLISSSGFYLIIVIVDLF